MSQIDQGLVRVYQLLIANPLTEGLVLRIRTKYELLCPLQENFIRKKTAQTVLLTWVFILLEISFIFFIHPGKFQALLAVALAIILHQEVIQFNVHSMELTLLVQFEQFITDIRHHYYVSHMVDEAIQDALDHTGYEMGIQANQFLSILTSKDCELLAEQYTISSHNGFLNLFLALCVTVVEYGDRTINGQSLFLLNLSNLKSETGIEILKIRQMNYLYSGLTFVILCPMTLLKIVERWGISNLPELEVFYSGMVGFIVMIGIVIASLLIYRIVSDLKEFRLYVPREYRVVDWILDKNWVRQRISWYENKCPARIRIWKERIEESGEIIQVRQILVMKLLYAVIACFSCMGIEIFYVVKERTRYEWYELIVSIGFVFFWYEFPDLRIRFHKKITQMNKEDEIIRYQSIVLMLMYIERITVLEILERVEEFAQIFRKPIQNCINDYNFSDLTALEELKEQGNFRPFTRFIDQLIIADEIGIEKAFDEVATDREHFREKRKQENAQSLEKRSSLAMFIAYIPAILVIGGYLILPFLIECYRKLNEYSEMMKSIV